MAFAAPGPSTRSRIAAVALGAGALVGAVALTATAATAADKIAVCHTGTGSWDKLVDIEPSVDGVVSGHEGHDGDIYPPFTVDGIDYPGKNWTAQGQAIYANSCVVPGAGPSQSATPEQSATSEETETPEATPTGDPTGDPTSGRTTEATSVVLADDDAADPDSSVLADTGADVAPLAGVAVLALALGAAGVLEARRRVRDGRPRHARQ